ncbi:MAG TPA: STAS domain-containing protein [Solirubrobacteraceae bacterium]|nr:STAS domain-containing protein [Solirubrobacteraceae bacterium]
MDFEMQTTENGNGSSRLLLRGELDLASGPRVQTELARLRDTGSTVILDLSELESMDSAGLVAILGSVQSAREAKATLEVDRRLRPPVARLFELTRSDDFLWPA